MIDVPPEGFPEMSGDIAIKVCARHRARGGGVGVGAWEAGGFCVSRVVIILGFSLSRLFAQR
jgi:hypothetical protein